MNVADLCLCPAAVTQADGPLPPSSYGHKAKWWQGGFFISSCRGGLCSHLL